MRQVWLAIFLAFALTAGGVARAMAAQACPMQAGASAMMHDCCPETQQPSNQDRDQQNMDGCMMGMACRAGPVVAPSIEPIRLPMATVSVSEPRLGDSATPRGPLQQLFRPPRTI